VSTRRQFLVLAAGAVAVSAVPGRGVARALAQSTPTAKETIAALALPEIAIVQTDQGFEAPSDLNAGRYRIVVTPLSGQRVELSVVSFPATLAAADVQAKWAESYASDMPLADTFYAGGVAVEDGKPGWVIVDLAAGDWTLALTPQALAGADAPPVSTLLPLMAMGDAAAATEEIPTTVAAQVTEFAFVGLKDKTLPAGSQIWSIENVGAQPHHIVLFGTPKLVTDADVQDMLGAMTSATPVAPPEWFQQVTDGGYVPVLTTGRKMWTEFDFKAGFYLAVCFISDVETHMPHVMEGMHQAFTVA
jgi:hypothetical protein